MSIFFFLWFIFCVLYHSGTKLFNGLPRIGRINHTKSIKTYGQQMEIDLLKSEKENNNNNKVIKESKMEIDDDDIDDNADDCDNNSNKDVKIIDNNIDAPVKQVLEGIKNTKLEHSMSLTYAMNIFLNVFNDCVWNKI